MMIRVWTLALALLWPLWVATGAGAAEPADEIDPLDAFEAEAPDEDPEVEKNGWTPGGFITAEIFNVGGNGQVSSIYGQEASNTGFRTINAFRIGADLMTPKVSLPLVKPRFYMNAGIEFGPAQDVVVEKVGGFFGGQPEAQISEDQFCMPGIGPLCPPSERPYTAPDQLLGTGSEIVANYEGLSWFGGLGASVSLPKPISMFDLRLGAVYVGEEWTAAGRFVSATGTPPSYVVVRGFANTQEDFHYIGPEFGIDINLARGDKLLVTVTTHVDLLWNVGGNAMRFDEPGIADFVFITEDFRWALGFGMRFSWRNAF